MSKNESVFNNCDQSCCVCLFAGTGMECFFANAQRVARRPCSARSRRGGSSWPARARCGRRWPWACGPRECPCNAGWTRRCRHRPRCTKTASTASTSPLPKSVTLTLAGTALRERTLVVLRMRFQSACETKRSKDTPVVALDHSVRKKYRKKIKQITKRLQTIEKTNTKVN